MEKKIRLFNIEKSMEGYALFVRRLENTSVATMIGTVVYSPAILDEISSRNASIITIDICIPCDVLEFIRQIKKISGARILMTCDFVQPDLIFSCLQSGASGYLERSAPMNRLEQAITDCAEGLIHPPLSILSLIAAKGIIQEADAMLKNIIKLFSKGFLMHDVTFQTGVSERDIKRSIFLSLHG